MNTFGYKMAWLAIKNTNPEEIIQKLQLPDLHSISWASGIEKIYEDYGKNSNILITLSVRGWVFIVGWYMYDLNSQDGKLEKLKNRMVELSNVFGEVQAFATHRVSEYHHWILARKGKIERCFAFSGERGEVLYNEGELTLIEEHLSWNKLKSLKWSPNEEDVMNIAGKWSINPQTIVDTDVNGKTCYIVYIPS
jgi:hypothetical protein